MTKDVSPADFGAIRSIDLMIEQQFSIFRGQGGSYSDLSSCVVGLLENSLKGRPEREVFEILAGVFALRYYRLTPKDLDLVLRDKVLARNQIAGGA